MKLHIKQASCVNLTLYFVVHDFLFYCIIFNIMWYLGNVCLVNKLYSEYYSQNVMNVLSCVITVITNTGCAFHYIICIPTISE